MEPNSARYVVVLSTRGNPDFGQNPRRPMIGVPNTAALVASLAEASRVCREWIEGNQVGGGNWTGGKVTDRATGTVIAQVSYNGRTWKPGAYPQPEIQDADLAASVTP
jgi:hypothetical protein